MASRCRPGRCERVYVYEQHRATAERVCDPLFLLHGHRLCEHDVRLECVLVRRCVRAREQIWAPTCRYCLLQKTRAHVQHGSRLAAAPGSSLQFPPSQQPTTFAQWQGTGKDLHSLVADPEFVNADGYDFSDLRATSPAVQTMHFVPIDTSAIGPRVRPRAAV